VFRLQRSQLKFAIRFVAPRVGIGLMT